MEKNWKIIYSLPHSLTCQTPPFQSTLHFVLTTHIFRGPRHVPLEYSIPPLLRRGTYSIAYSCPLMCLNYSIYRSIIIIFNVTIMQRLLPNVHQHKKGSLQICKSCVSDSSPWFPLHVHVVVVVFVKELSLFNFVTNIKHKTNKTSLQIEINITEFVFNALLCSIITYPVLGFCQIPLLILQSLLILSLLLAKIAFGSS